MPALRLYTRPPSRDPRRSPREVRWCALTTAIEYSGRCLPLVRRPGPFRAITAMTAALLSACDAPEREPSRGLLSLRQAYELASVTSNSGHVGIPLDLGLLMAVTSYHLSQATLDPGEQDQYEYLQRAATKNARKALFDVASRPFEAIFTTRSVVQAAAYSDDGRFLYTRHADKVLMKWDLQTRQSWELLATSSEATQARRSIRIAETAVSRVLVDGGRSMAVLDSEGGLRILNITTRRSIQLLEPPDMLANRFALSVSSNGRWLVMVTDSGDLALWDMAERRKVYRARRDRPFASSVFRPVNAAIMAPDGRSVALVGSEHNVNRAIGGRFGARDRGLIVIRQLFPPNDPTDPRRVEFDKTIDLTAAVNSRDWNDEQAMRRVCGVVGRSLTLREWEEYVNTTSTEISLGLRADLPHVEVCASNRSR